MKTIADHEYMEMHEAAKYLGISISTLKIYIARSKAGLMRPRLPFIQFRKRSRIYFDREALQNYVEAKAA